MKQLILAALVSGTLLTNPTANAEELSDLPVAAPSTGNAALVHVPQQGPQENEKATADRESAKSKAPEQDNASENGAQELSTTTMAATSESGAADTAVPDSTRATDRSPNRDARTNFNDGSNGCGCHGGVRSGATAYLGNMPMKQSDKGVAELAFDRTMKSLGLSHTYGRVTGLTGGGMSLQNSWASGTHSLPGPYIGPYTVAGVELSTVIDAGIIFGGFVLDLITVPTPGLETAAAVGTVIGRRKYSDPLRSYGWESSKDASGVARCGYCGKQIDKNAGKPNSYEADHTVPYSRGGKTNSDNLTPSCRTCNRSKGARTPDEWGGSK